MAGYLIGWTDGTSTTYDLTDAQGSVLPCFSKRAIQGEQLYDPYGHPRYATGVLGTDKGYTGQFTDTATGLDYYNARYYLRDIGVFLSPDSVQGNAQGMDPYSYVMGNPETNADPTGNSCVGASATGLRPNCGGGGSAGGPGCPKGTHPSGGNCVSDGTGTTDTGCTWHGKRCSATNNPCHGNDIWGGDSKGCIVDPRQTARNDKLSKQFILSQIFRACFANGRGENKQLSRSFI